MLLNKKEQKYKTGIFENSLKYVKDSSQLSTIYMPFATLVLQPPNT